MDLSLACDDFGSLDLVASSSDLKTDDSLRTAVLISIFTDSRASIDELPNGETDQRGFWGDSLDESEGFLGSKLWLLDRGKITNNELERAKVFVEDSLKWLITDKIARKISVSVSRKNNDRYINVDIERYSGSDSKFSFLWEGE